MNNEITTTQNNDTAQWTAQQVETLRQTICPNLNHSEMQLFQAVCAEKGLSPFSKEIHAIKTRQGMAIVTGIDGYRRLAQRSGEYEGQTEPMWCGKDGKWVDVWLQDGPPAAAKVGVYRRGFREPAWGVAVFRDYAKGNLWDKMPSVMIAKVAESVALRKAFGDHLAGLYTREEMEQAIVYETPKNAPVNTQQNRHAQPQQQANKPTPMPEKTVLVEVMGLIAQIISYGVKSGWEVKAAVNKVYGLMGITGKDQLKTMDELELEGFEVTLKEMLDNVDEVFQIQQ